MSTTRANTSWRWWVCGLLLLASTINYMDRQTLANASVRITTQFKLGQEHYGIIEMVFGWAFASGSLLFGIAADRWSVRWLYPLVLALWSAVGFATGLVESSVQLLICRGLLGFFEGGHWPCAIKTTQRLLEPRDRSMGNSVLQSGTSIGAIATPLLMSVFLNADRESWRAPFQIVGSAGLLWVALWLILVRKGDLAVTPVVVPTTGANPSPEPGRAGASIAIPKAWDRWGFLFSRRMLVLFFVVACINTCWQTLRAWLPKFLQESRGYGESDALHFNALFYVATDIGCLGAGALTLWLARRGASIHRSRVTVFLGCAALSALTVAAALLPKGPLLLGVLLLVGAGALGVFPVYHALTQDVSVGEQGKVTGMTGVAAWILSSPAQTLFGRLIDRTGSFDLGLACAGLLPLLAFVALWIAWPPLPQSQPPSAIAPANSP